MIFWITSSTQIIFLKILYFFLIALLGYTPVGIFLWGLITSLIERGRLSKGEFEVSVAKVSFKGEKLVGRHLEEFLHLKDFGNVRVDHTTFQLADRGDEYYVIHYKKTVKLYYSLEMYEYREE